MGGIGRIPVVRMEKVMASNIEIPISMQLQNKADGDVLCVWLVAATARKKA